MTTTPSNAWTGVRELDWAQLQEQCTLPLQSAVLDAAKVTRGTRMLDDGCGTGILSVLATMRGTSNLILFHTDLMGTFGTVSLNPGVEQTAYGVFSDLVELSGLHAEASMVRTP